MKTALIIGAGPAGLAAAYELTKNSDIKPIIIELDSQVGGLSKTILYNGNRLDIGPHRFFSKNKRVNELWQEILSMPKINRLTRILFLHKFFNYPIDLSLATLKNLGPKRVLKIIFSYLRIKIKPLKPEKSLADFFTNRFGRELYSTFFEYYTEKVWGVPCEQIPPDWGAQRVKELSISKLIGHFFKKIFRFRQNKKVQTSLIEQFYYPLYGAGQMYEAMAEKIKAKGGEINLNHELMSFKRVDNKIKSALVRDRDGILKEIEADYFISTMPIKELINRLDFPVPDKIKELAANLVYRDYIIIGLSYKKIAQAKKILDNWIYVQERDIKMGRLDFFNNFSPNMSREENNIWLGAEYFCNENDEFWQKNDLDLRDFAAQELERMKITLSLDLLDYKVVRVTKAYPAYFGSYNRLAEIREYTDNFTNLFLIGRNGMHRYNNMDHSILSGLMAANNIISGRVDKNNLWEINTESEYAEE